jgi:hypothetical protein
MSKRTHKRVWDVTYLDENGESIDSTQIDEKRAKLAWELFAEFGHTKQRGYKLEWTPAWEEID